ncbi:substrate-binding periplasmic protein [Pseudomonas sp. NY15181]|uniref:substrate-binding periplasmic protein n=1 Tax=Pseudomonas sp. NY15181 TaxID=3400349 RepID=UPI003A87373A
MRRSLTPIALACLLASGSVLAAEACKPAHKFETVSPGTLTVVTMVIPPFSLPEGGKINGVDGEIITRIAEMECLTLNPIVADTRAVMQYVVTGQADVAVGNWFRTATRAKAMGMTNPVYLDSLAIYTKDGTRSLGELLDKGVRVGTVQGYNWVSDAQKMFGASAKLYPSPVALAQDLEAGRIDAGLDSYSGGVYAQQQGSLKGLKIVHATPDERVKASIEPAQIAFTFAKGNDVLGNALNDDIKALQEKGEIVKALTNFGLSAKDAEVGAPRLIE